MRVPPGLWLIVSKEPKNFTEEDYENYANLMIKTNALHRGNYLESKYAKSSSGYTWKNILRDIWLKEKEVKFIRESQKEKKKSMRKDFLIQGNIIMERALWLFRAILTPW